MLINPFECEDTVLNRMWFLSFLTVWGIEKFCGLERCHCELSLLVCLLLVSKVCWLIWCPSVLIKVIAGLYCFENLLLLVVLFCFVIVGKICYLHLSAVFCWLFPRILLACVFVS